jgi:hypothetical protein
MEITLVTFKGYEVVVQKFLKVTELSPLGCPVQAPLGRGCSVVTYRRDRITMDSTTERTAGNYTDRSRSRNPAQAKLERGTPKSRRNHGTKVSSIDRAI